VEVSRKAEAMASKKDHEPDLSAYDDAVRGRPPVHLDITETTANEQQRSRDERRVDEEANEAANDVRRREHSAD
jgi:hypothetical protein